MDLLRCVPSVSSFWNDNQHVDVTIRPHLPSRSRAEQDDPQRMSHLNNATNQFINNLRIPNLVSIITS
jgi:hypothetical protein